MGKFAFVEFYDKSHKTVSLEAGVKMQKVLDNEIEPENEAQANYVLNIKRIYLPPSVRKPADAYGYIPRPAKDMTNPGVLQGVNEQLPTGDR